MVRSDNFTPLVVADWGLQDYQLAFEKQELMVSSKLLGETEDTLVFVEHPATVTLGRRATAVDLHFDKSEYAERKIAVLNVNRGGLATAHEQGQLVVYPIIALKKKNLHWYADNFLQVVVALLTDYNVEGYLKKGEPGVWVDGCKICSFGVAIKKWVTSHGIAININNSLDVFSTIVPCGQSREQITSLKQILGHEVDVEIIKKRFVDHFCATFKYSIERS